MSCDTQQTCTRYRNIYGHFLVNAPTTRMGTHSSIDLDVGLPAGHRGNIFCAYYSGLPKSDGRSVVSIMHPATPTPACLRVSERMVAK